MKRNKKKAYLIIAFLLIAIIIASIFLYGLNQVNISFVDENDIEYGSNVRAEDLVVDYEGDNIKYPTLDTYQLGTQKLVYTIDSFVGERKVVKEINVIDSQKPIIELVSESCSVRKGNKFNPKENIKAVYDVVDGELEYQIEGDYDLNNYGNYTLTVKATDKNNNQSEASFNLEVRKAKKEVIDGVTYFDGIMLVNKEYGLPEDYGFEDPVARQHLDELRSDAEDAGYYLDIISGFRDYSYQYDVYWGWVALDGQELADTYSARPGFSEHQTGLTWDIGLLEDWFGETDAGIWLEENCANYGFIIRYPLGKEDITGYKYEPWHVRYVGEEHSHTIMDNDLCLEEYLGLVE